jgi:hypothetical protein
VSTINNEALEKIPSQNYSTSEKPLPVYRILFSSEVTPVDLNLQFIMEEGWNQTDRLRLHTFMEILADEEHPLFDILKAREPHILLRRFNIEEDSFIAVSIYINGEITILSNNKEYTHKYLSGLLLNFPPGFYTSDQFEIIEEGWVEDEIICAMFCGMLMARALVQRSEDMPTLPAPPHRLLMIFRHYEKKPCIILSKDYYGIELSLFSFLSLNFHVFFYDLWELEDWQILELDIGDCSRHKVPELFLSSLDETKSLELTGYRVALR